MVARVDLNTLLAEWRSWFQSEVCTAVLYLVHALHRGWDESEQALDTYTKTKINQIEI